MITAAAQWLTESTFDPTPTRAGVMTAAVQLYNGTRMDGVHSKVVSALLRRPHHLLKLDAAHVPAHDAGLQTVPTRQIRGSENRTSDFDDQFHPLQARTRERWLSVAAARLTGTELPPVELIQVGDIYYVRDGHHRLSVARSLGEEFIDAHVTAWV